MDERTLAVVQEFENELREKVCRENDGDCRFSDLTGLYMDIISELSKADKEKSLIIYDYSKLLERELQFYSSTEAYKAGYETKGKTQNEIMYDYLDKIMEGSHKQSLDTRIQGCFDEIKILLDDKHGLITEFTETYIMVHGTVKNNIHEFIRLGQNDIQAAA